jgi:phosphotransferase system HPr-like phosphotransfer protein
MVKRIKVTSFTEVKNIMNAASQCPADVGVHDAQGGIADAKSILGLMGLDYTHPVLLVSEDAQALDHVYNAMH